MRTNIFSALCITILLSITLPMHAQTTDNVSIKANALYEENKFKEALPLLEQAYKEKPADAEIALKYGVSLYETRQNLGKAIILLSEASKKKQTEAYLYLGDVYTELYRFSDASREYDQYAKLKKKDSHALSLVGRKTEEMNQLKKLVSRTENIQIIDSVIVNKNDLLSAYKLSPSCGRLAYFKDVFTSNMNIESTVYYNEKGSKIYFAQPEEGLYTLFTMDKLLDGFANEKKMDADNFGLTQNINYVFVMPDGTTTYFAAEDANGIGGYDLYVTRYNINTNTYLTPERLNMPFNSRYN
ncbi:MAG: tetratricopeptide repeat protein, partial [Dysgonomonas sp.]